VELGFESPASPSSLSIPRWPAHRQAAEQEAIREKIALLAGGNYVIRHRRRERLANALSERNPITRVVSCLFGLEALLSSKVESI
jgi:hypothetical protein